MLKVYQLTTEITELENNTTRSITEESEYDLNKLLAEYEIQASSPYNDGWTAEHYKKEAEKIKEKLKQLNG